MKTLLFCTSYFSDANAWESRYQRWLDYYKNGPIEATCTLLIDDGSPYLPPEEVISSASFDDGAAALKRKEGILRYRENLGRQNMHTYPGWWRSFLGASKVAEDIGAEKIVHIESDAYVLSQRLANFINEVDSGWHVLWASRYGMPETAIQVICKDQFEALKRFSESHRDFLFPDIAERILPFTSVHREFKGDRYSEFKRNRGIFRSRKFNFLPIFKLGFFWEPIPVDADFATQVVPRQKVAFGARNVDASGFHRTRRNAA
ncbi:hypothetical protein AB870_02145 [Pandoraea faecigallinarum]|uniref:Glycosyltransferase n=1 Tax=Pandoraea faecigallinarum TaxID=656179 RepID=A0A0H3WRL3_9BURK|nr:hypothetical protein [Pandoraea faecigallinarum]AKM29176.1 hypothetical protein AB870_02145 [Pandoraea faecigallinarum]